MPRLNRFAVRWAWAFLISAARVAGCYRYVDVPLAQWAHHHQLHQYGLFHGLQVVADGLVLLAPVMLLTVGGCRVRGRIARWDRAALRAALSVLAVALLKYPLKWAFGRTWPATFYQNNPYTVARRRLRVSSLSGGSRLQRLSVGPCRRGGSGRYGAVGLLPPLSASGRGAVTGGRGQPAGRLLPFRRRRTRRHPAGRLRGVPRPARRRPRVGTAPPHRD